METNNINKIPKWIKVEEIDGMTIEKRVEPIDAEIDSSLKYQQQYDDVETYRYTKQLVTQNPFKPATIISIKA